VNVTFEGQPYLVAAIGTWKFSNKFIKERVSEWLAEVFLLAKLLRVNHMLLILHCHMDLPAGGVVCFIPCGHYSLWRM